MTTFWRAVAWVFASLLIACGSAQVFAANCPPERFGLSMALAERSDAAFQRAKKNCSAIPAWRKVAEQFARGETAFWRCMGISHDPVAGLNTRQAEAEAACRGQATPSPTVPAPTVRAVPPNVAAPSPVTANPPNVATPSPVTTTPPNVATPSVNAPTPRINQPTISTNSPPAPGPRAATEECRNLQQDLANTDSAMTGLRRAREFQLVTRGCVAK